MNLKWAQIGIKGSLFAESPQCKTVSLVCSLKQLPRLTIFKKIDRRRRFYVTKLGNTKSLPCSVKNSCRILNHTCPVAVTRLRWCHLSFVYTFHSFPGQFFSLMAFLSLMNGSYILLYPLCGRQQNRARVLFSSFLLSINPAVEIQNKSAASCKYLESQT